MDPASTEPKIAHFPPRRSKLEALFADGGGSCKDAEEDEGQKSQFVIFT